ncbi:MAG: vWA domain-containing protein [Polyangiaceae bacterium]
MNRALGSMVVLLLLGCSAGEGSDDAVVPPGGGAPSTPFLPSSPAPGASGGLPPAGSEGAAPGQFGSPEVAAEGNCGLQYFDVQRRPADVLLVLDRSGSMEETPDGATDETSKWDLTVPALRESILETDSAVSWGMKLFPEGQDTESCSAETITDTIHVPINAANGGTVVGAIEATTPTGDGTPTGDAVRAAVRYLSTLTTPDRKFIVLATDGEPSCGASGEEGQDDARPYAVAAITDAVAAGIPVFVVGVATTNDSATEALNYMALAGGAARPDPNPLATRYYLANTQAELVSTLRTITGEIASCVFPLSAAPPAPDNIAVKVGGTLVERDATRANGWEYTGNALMELEVYGSWCEQIKAAAAADVQVIYACEGVIIR